MVRRVTDSDIRTPGVIDELSSCLCSGFPNSLEVTVVLIGTIVHVVAAACITDGHFGTPGHTMGFLPVTIAGGNTGNVRTVRVVMTQNKGSAYFKLFTLVIDTEAVFRFTGLAHIGKRIAGAVFGIGTASRDREKTIGFEFRVR